jgi:proline iminopeptidase
MIQDPQTWLYPSLEPYRTDRLDAGDGHSLYFEECGNPHGKPVVFVHGGPGGGTSADDRRFFDPNRYRIILVHQRGSGNSTPAASLHENTTWKLVQDMEKLRTHLNLDSWQLFGGSWGSTLSLAYAILHPKRVTEMVLRGIFMTRKKEIDWFYQDGASSIFPDVWAAYRDHIPENERDDFVKAYYQRLTHEDEKVRIEAAIPWTTWEMATARIYTAPDILKTLVTPEFAIKFARIECHYFMNLGFFEHENWILDNIDKIRTIPAVIVQGRYDVVCPATTAWDLHRAWPQAKFLMIPDAGHSSRDPGISRALVAATDGFSGKKTQ